MSKLYKSSTSLAELLTSAVLVVCQVGCGAGHKVGDALLLELPVSLNERQAGELSFEAVLPNGSYICSLAVIPRDSYPSGEETEVEATFAVTFPQDPPRAGLVERSLVVKANEFAEAYADAAHNSALAQKQKDAVLPHPWTYTAGDPAGSERLVWAMYPPFTIPEDGQRVRVEVEVRVQQELAADLGQWTFRFERFLDAI